MSFDEINVSSDILGIQSAAPILVAPMAHHKLLSGKGEIDTAKACLNKGVPLALAH